MALTPLILIGVPQIMANEDEVFALPGRWCKGFVEPQAAALEVSNTKAGTFIALVKEADGTFETAAAFIRNGNTTDCTVVLKAQ